MADGSANVSPIKRPCAIFVGERRSARKGFVWGIVLLAIGLLLLFVTYGTEYGVLWTLYYCFLSCTVIAAGFIHCWCRLVCRWCISSGSCAHGVSHSWFECGKMKQTWDGIHKYTIGRIDASGHSLIEAGETPDPNFLESHPLNIRRTLQPGLSLAVRSEAVPRIDWDQPLARPINGSSMRLELGVPVRDDPPV